MELAVITEQTAVAAYSGGIDAALERIATEARAQTVDISTKKGREACASLAYKVARSKTLIDETGKKLGEDARKKIEAINADRNKARTFLDGLRDEVRQPLTDWEQAEERRVADHQANLDEIAKGGIHTSLHWQTLSVEAMQDRLTEISISRRLNWEEFSTRAMNEISRAELLINTAIETRASYDHEQSELARLRAEEEARKKRERDESIARQAAETARLEAERQAALAARLAEQKAQAELRAAEVKAENERAEAERQRLSIEREKQEAEARAIAAEEATKREEEARVRQAKEWEERAAKQKAEAEEIFRRAEANAEQARQSAKLKASEDQQRAIEAERSRAAAEAKATADAAAQREADLKHRAKINKAAMLGLVSIGLTELVAQSVIVAIYNGKVPNVKVTY